MLFPTTLVGSYPQPDWLIDRDKLAKRFPPRLRAKELWRVPEPWLAQAQNDCYQTGEQAAMDYAAAVNEEIRDLFAAGADMVQIDEPRMQARPEKARQYGLKALNRALPYVRKENVILAPDCGMKYLPREVAFGKMKAMVEAAGILRAEFT